ncbi:hypothetical protein Q9L58_009498 [Maublancomyces gigas]|uniref:Uncharacterized protein n=1 Tax=Discina gigas TaxID=1032678 RepID=A0ABR3G6R1_9PEZI
MPLLPDNTQPSRQTRQLRALPQRGPPQNPIPSRRRNPDLIMAHEVQPTMTPRDTWYDKSIDPQSLSAEAAYQGLRRLSGELMDVILEMGSLPDAELGHEAFEQLLDRILAVNQDALEFLRTM